MSPIIKSIWLIIENFATVPNSDIFHLTKSRLLKIILTYLSVSLRSLFFFIIER